MVGNVSNSGSNLSTTVTITETTQGRSKRASSVPPPNSTAQPQSVRISPLADLINKLQALKQSDPAKLQETLSAISDRLKTAADQTGDASAKSALTKLADRFSQAASTGDLSALTTQAGAAGRAGRGYHAHRHREQSGSASEQNPVRQALVDVRQLVDQALTSQPSPAASGQ